MNLFSLKIVSQLSVLSFLGIGLLFFNNGMAASKKEENPLAPLLQELQALKNQRKAKMEALEKTEAERWDARYRQQNEIQNQETKIRKLEGDYSRLAGVQGQKQEELIRLGNETRSREVEKEASLERLENFKIQVYQAIEKETEKSSFDIPIGITQRTLDLATLSQSSNPDPKANTSSISHALSQFFKYKHQRLDLTHSQELKQVETLFEGKADNALRLRLGTVFAGEVSQSDPNMNQLLLRTGKLQGKVFVWQSDLAAEHAQRLPKAISDAKSGTSEVNLTIDVLQNKSWGTGYTSDKEEPVLQTAKAWFAQGGLVMYPLMLSALIGLLLSLERLIFFARKSWGTKMFGNKVLPIVEQKNWEGALSFCRKSKTSLSRVVENVLKNNHHSREVGEKAGKESLLKELPALEKRMVLLAAIGGAAPLMGLLGTVSGMISLFQVITDVGTNDPRILAGGISEALITTQTGLIIAIPILLVHGYLSDRIDRIQSEITARSFEVLNKVWPQGSKK